VAFFLAKSFAGNSRVSASEAFKGKIFLDNDKLIDAQFRLLEVQSLERSKSPVTCTIDTNIQDAAQKMSDFNVGSIIVVNEDFFPIGIITDKDFRKKVATGQVALSDKVSEIMSAPVITALPRVTVADVQIRMVKHKIHHICLTEDGTNQSKVIGVLSEHDLLVIQANNPAVLIRSIFRAKHTRSLKELRNSAEQLLQKYLYQEVSIAYISTIMTEINDAIIQRCIELGLKEMDDAGYGRPKESFCWLAMGSEGREEQLLRTDQDNALIFEDPAPAKEDLVKSYYLQLSEIITKKLYECGFDYCPGDMMASNPNWCMSLSDWKTQFSSWMLHPEPKSVMMTTIFFDYRPIYGNTNLSEQLTAHIFETISEQEIFLSFLAKDALKNPPPLTFFRNIMVERSGEHKNEFDIKMRAMMPLADAARVLILSQKLGKVNNTFRRFDKLAELEPQNKELYEQAADAYEILMRYRALQGLKNKNTGRFFNPSELTKMERINLRNAFQPISDLQSLLNMRFRLAYFN
jgi:CBS domain-containing protein